MIAEPPIRALVVDDEALARDVLATLLAADPSVELVAECGTGDEALACVRAEDPDLVFLDVHLPDRDGLDVLAGLGESRRAEVVLVTAFDEYALRAFDARALDYLLKPFDDDRFLRALTRAKERVRRARVEEIVRRLSALTQVEPARGQPQRTSALPALISLRDARGVTLLDPREVDWIQAEDYYALLHVGPKSYLHRESLRDLEARLGARFVRVHRSALVNLDQVRELRTDPEGGARLVLRGGAELPLSRSGRRRLEASLPGARR